MISKLSFLDQVVLDDDYTIVAGATDGVDQGESDEDGVEDRMQADELSGEDDESAQEEEISEEDAVLHPKTDHGGALGDEIDGEEDGELEDNEEEEQEEMPLPRSRNRKAVASPLIRVQQKRKKHVAFSTTPREVQSDKKRKR